jgi:type IV fimbrial biogenesis protein FimT
MIELLVSMSITASALLASAGGMHDLHMSQRLKSVAAELESEIQLARSTAVLRGQTMRLAIQPLDQGSCILIHTGPKDACTCGATGEAVCEGDAQVTLLQRHDAKTGVRYLTNQVSLAFSADHGTVTPTATIKLVDSTGRALHQVINVMGRTRTCSPKSAIPGYKPC